MKRVSLLFVLAWVATGCGHRAGGAAEVWVFRHSAYTRESGSLTPKGRALAKMEARKLKGQPFDAIYSSPVTRCRETAEVFGQEFDSVDKITVVDWLQDTPEFDGSLARLPSGKRLLVFTHSPNILKIREHHGMDPGGVDYCEGTKIVVKNKSEPSNAP